MDLIKLKDIKYHRLSDINFTLKDWDCYKNNTSRVGYDWNRLKKSIESMGWNPSTYSYITISNDNYCVNGHHRIILLKDLFGEEFEVQVIKLKDNYTKILLKNILKDIVTLNFKKKIWIN